MSENQVRLAEMPDLEWILPVLRTHAVRNAAVIQDLMRWPERSKFYFLEGKEGLSFLHYSGHPAHHETPALIADGEALLVARLLDHCKPKAPFVIRETDASLAPVVLDYFPETTLYREQRMDLTRESYTPLHRGIARQLTESDAPALAQFFGAPPQAASRFIGWLKGARAFHGAFEGNRLAAIGSSMISIPEAWNLVSIETHPDFRGKGLATEVTSSLVERALQDTSTVAVTVQIEKASAIRVYEKVGFKPAQDRIWADCGAGSSP